MYETLPSSSWPVFSPTFTTETQNLIIMHPSGVVFRSVFPCLKLSGCMLPSMKMNFNWSALHHGPLHGAKRFQGRDAVIFPSLKSDLRNGNYVSEQSRHSIVLDIEGTTTPISFVTDVLFPYAHDNVRQHFFSTYESEETQDDIKLLRAQVQNDLEQGVAGSAPIPSENAGKEEIIEALLANVESMIRADRKITALKQLQGHIWRYGFQNKELKGVVFDDVPETLKKWHASGIKEFRSPVPTFIQPQASSAVRQRLPPSVSVFQRHPPFVARPAPSPVLAFAVRLPALSSAPISKAKQVYIYSSGSREAQRLIFGYTIFGDLRRYLCGFFDTTTGNKRETHSYFQISQSIGVDTPSQILFVTDVYQEAMAAKEAGLEVVISIRPGNGPLPENHGFKTVTSFAEI